ncbi:MAG: hypothetical protein LBB06_03480 [Endomicrobium sp.]|jgi:hypothetical protein|nr:hypothetical protein [Endomicrobium sp.]
MMEDRYSNSKNFIRLYESKSRGLQKNDSRLNKAHYTMKLSLVLEIDEKKLLLSCKSTEEYSSKEGNLSSLYVDKGKAKKYEHFADAKIDYKRSYYLLYTKSQEMEFSQVF